MGNEARMPLKPTLHPGMFMRAVVVHHDMQLQMVRKFFVQPLDGRTLYAIVLELPKDGKVTIKSLAAGSDKWLGKLSSVRLIGGGKLKFARDAAGSHVSLPEKHNGKIALALKIRS
jgi:hypothetical protein